jgi:hypothetical protein
MEREKELQSILKAVESEVRTWLDEEPNYTDPIKYERDLLARCLRIGGHILQQSQGLPRDRNLKKKL